MKLTPRYDRRLKLSSKSHPMDGILAFLVVIAAHLILLLLLKQTKSTVAHDIHGNEPRLAMFNVERSVTNIVPLSTKTEVTRTKRNRQALESQVSRQPAPHSSLPGMPLKKEASAPATTAPSGPLDLAIRMNDIEFSDTPKRRPSEAAFTKSESILRFHFEDRSLLGRYARMSRSAACSELRRALWSNPASAEAIIRAMEQRHCGK